MLEDTIYSDYIKAFKSRQKEQARFLSFIRAELKNAAIGLRKEKLSDEEVISVLNRQRKRLKEAQESAADSGRSDFLAEIKQQIAVLSEYLPEPLSDDELICCIDECADEMGAAKDMGKLMKAVLSRVGVRADAKKVSSLVKKKLSS